MNTTKSDRICEICKREAGIYSCPRCNRRFCSSNCYKCPDHEMCSESFYREWVEESLKNENFDRLERENMLQILKRSADACEEEIVPELSIEDRFANLDINSADEEAIWDCLNDEEKKNFKLFVEDEKNIETLIPVKQPWWTVTMINLVTELDADKYDENDHTSPRPHFPLNIQKLSDLTSVKPSESIQYNLVNILYAYCFLYRFYNCDLRDFLEEVVGEIFELSPALMEHNYCSLVECVQDSIRLISSHHSDVPVDFVKSIVNDVCSIMKGPDNAKSSTFVLCALHDVKLLIFELKFAYKEHDKRDKTCKKKLNLAIKKMDFLMSWCLDNDSAMSDIASDLVLLMLPDMVSDSQNESASHMESNDLVKTRPLIEEIE
ncbi:zinc finger HIT domain-containing protein 2-like [Uloborus diversus]|uniref:zinc finger HIT domain-containing protein 2-like n=1 Tax=Uloborus diversus TaxID=327109 RepID=UPI002409819F|nr:zinc finger HIT domain-containing protein 2-like [Uloborus diversus]